MKMSALKPAPLNLCIWLLGMLGVASVLPVLPMLFSLQPVPPPVPVWVVIVGSAAQSAILLFLLVWLGAVFAPKVNLSAPVIAALLARRPAMPIFKSQIIPALMAGLLGGILILVLVKFFQPYLPPAFLVAAAKLEMPWYARIFYGGITEEILMRWGLMSFLVWASYRLLQRDLSAAKKFNYFIAILLSALIFGFAHFPMIHSLTPETNGALIAYVLLGNASFGVIAGGLYWKFGLECAMLAHMVAHLTIITATGVFS